MTILDVILGLMEDIERKKESLISFQMFSDESGRLTYYTRSHKDVVDSLSTEEFIKSKKHVNFINIDDLIKKLKEMKNDVNKEGENGSET